MPIPPHVQRALDEHSARRTLANPTYQALVDIGRRPFTKEDLRQALGGQFPSHEFVRLLQSGVLKADETGLRVTDFGWDWIANSP